MTSNTKTIERPEHTMTNTPMKAAMFGCGNMGQSLLSGWADTDQIAFSVVDPALPNVGKHAVVLADAKDLPETDWSIAIIAVKPQLIPMIMEQAGHVFKSADLVLSIAAGVSMETLEKHVGDKPIIRMMPNMPASIGKGVSGLYGNDKCSDRDRDIVTDMASRNGELVWVETEDAIDRFTAIAGSGPGYVFEILRLYTIAAMEMGFDEDEARKLVTQTVIGSAEMAAQSDKSLEDLRKSVTSKNGTTEAGLSKLMEGDKLKELLSETVEAAYKRALELR